MGTCTLEEEMPFALDSSDRQVEGDGSDRSGGHQT